MRWTGAGPSEVVEQARRTAQMQAFDVARPGGLEGGPHSIEERALLEAQVRALEHGHHAPRAQLRADQPLVEVDAGELGEPFVHRVGEGEDPLRDLARRGDQDHHDEARLQREDLDVPQRGGRDRRRRYHRHELGDARQRLGGLAQGVVDLAASAVVLEQDGRRRLAPLRHHGVDVVPVAGIGGYAARRRVRVREHAQVLEVGEVVADRRSRDPEAGVLAEVLRAHRGAGGDVLFDDGPKDLLLPCRERQPTPLNA